MCSSVISLTKVLEFSFFLIGIVIFVTVLLVPPKNPIQAYSQATQTIPATRKSAPIHIQIGTYIDLPVQEMPFGPSGWEVATNAASIASTSARPGESGNIIIYSHNLRRLFGHLSQAKVGDRVTVTAEDGSIQTYTVRNRQIVNPDQVESLLPTDYEVLTLYTCSGLFDSKRLVIQALP